MNNEHLRRAKRRDNGEWVRGQLIKDYCGCFITPEDCINERLRKDGRYGYEIISLRAFEVDPSTICSCSGLPDINNRLIYERDIIRDSDGDIGVVKYGLSDVGIPAYIIWYTNQYDFMLLGGKNVNLLNIEVIGNAIDNPDLKK